MKLSRSLPWLLFLGLLLFVIHVVNMRAEYSLCVDQFMHSHLARYETVKAHCRTLHLGFPFTLLR